MLIACGMMPFDILVGTELLYLGKQGQVLLLRRMDSVVAMTLRKIFMSAVMVMIVMKI